MSILSYVLIAAVICSSLASSHDPAFDEALRRSPLRSLSGVKVRNFIHNDCGWHQALVKVNKLEITPDLKVTANVEVKTDLDNSLAIDVVVQKKIWILGFKNIPCQHGLFGSCTHTNICDKIPKLDECPAEFVENKLPCQCPMPAGNYSLVDFDVMPSLHLRSISSVLMQGPIKIGISLRKGTQKLACHNVQFNLAA